MVEKILKLLNGKPGIDGFSIKEETVVSKEVFFVKKHLDMNRGKEVKFYYITVYKSFEEKGQQYTGHSQVKVSPAMNFVDIELAVDQGIIAAGLVKNKAYSLVDAEKETKGARIELSPEEDLTKKLTDIIKGVYKEDHYEGGGINSLEVFVYTTTTRTLTSTGIDVTEIKHTASIEVISEWNEGKEPVEIFRLIDFSEFDEDYVRLKVKGAIASARHRAVADALDLSQLENLNVILKGKDVAEFLSYYIDQSNAENIYMKYSKAALGESIQGENLEGDLLNISLIPVLKGSSHSRYIDDDGVLLQSVQLIKDSVLNHYHGPHRYTEYLGVPTTGRIENIVIEGGEHSLEALKAASYLEIDCFSDFQMDGVTGDFAGEIRLAFYNDGKEVKVVTGGAIGGNIKKVEKSLLLSKEIEQNDNFICPMGISIKDVSIS